MLVVTLWLTKCNSTASMTVHHRHCSQGIHCALVDCHIVSWHGRDLSLVSWAWRRWETTTSSFSEPAPSYNVDYAHTYNGRDNASVWNESHAWAQSFLLPMRRRSCPFSPAQSAPTRARKVFSYVCSQRTINFSLSVTKNCARLLPVPPTHRAPPLWAAVKGKLTKTERSWCSLISVRYY